MKYLVLICSLLFSNLLVGQRYWSNNITEAELKDTSNNKYWVLDTCTIHLNEGSYSRKVSNIEKLYDFTKYFLSRPDYQLEILFLKNSNYDTISTHWGRLMPSQIKEKMTYFNLDPLNFEIRDSIVTEFDAMLDDKTLYRKVIFKVKPNTAYQKYLNILNTAYKNRDQEMIYELFVKDYKTPNDFLKIHEASEFDISGLIDLYYRKKYKKSLVSKLEILPSSYPIEIGKIRKVSGDWYDEEENITIAFDDFIDIQVKSDLSLHYKYQFPDRNVHHLNPSLDLAIKSFLGYEFDYDKSEVSSLPSNILPIGETRRKLAFLEKYISPRVEVLERGMCHLHIFWNFNWVSVEPWTISKIGLDIEEKKAYVFSYKESNPRNCVIYQFEKSKWKEIETLNSSRSSEIEDSNVFKRITLLYFSVIGLLSILFIFWKRKLFGWSN